MHPTTLVVQPWDCVLLPVCNDHAQDMVTRHSKVCAHLRHGFSAATALQLPVLTVSCVLEGVKAKWMLRKISLMLQSALGSWLWDSASTK